MNNLTMKSYIVWLLACLANTSYASEEDQTTTPESAPQEYEFNSSFLFGSNSQFDIEQFSKAGYIPPGEYDLWVSLNNHSSFQQNIQVRSDLNQDTSITCFKESDFKMWGVRINELPNQELYQTQANNQCLILDELIPHASFTIDLGKMQASLSIPQAYLDQPNRDYIDPKDWRYGINAGFIRYNAFASFYDYDDDFISSYNLNLTAGLNLGRWRLRHNGNYSYQEESGDYESDYNSLNTYLQTDIDALKAQITLGEYYTQGDILDSTPFTGVSIASDDSMLPSSERGYAPVIRGNASTNAKVKVYQDEQLLYSTNVPPGDFVIDELYATGYAGDLRVEVEESNGQVKSFIVPYASVVQMLRPGQSRFSATAGRYRDDQTHGAPWFMQGTYRYGINNAFTTYTGANIAQDYYAATLGIAYASVIGAIALDATYSYSNDIPEPNDYQLSAGSGQSYRITYNKLVQSTNTNFALAAYRFSSEDYLTFNQFARLQESDPESISNFREKQRFQFNISQSLGDWGNVYAYGLRSTYWGDLDDTSNFQIGYSTSFSWGSFTTSMERVFEEDDNYNNYRVRLSIPLNFSTNYSSLSTEYNYYENSEQHSVRTDYSSSYGDYNQLNYSAYINQTFEKRSNDSTSYGLNLDYTAPYSRLNAGASFSDAINQYTLSTSGTVIGYADGLIFTSAQGENMAILEADGAAGAKVVGTQGNTLTGSGKTAVANLTSYRYNNVSLDTREVSDLTELQSTSQRVAPRKGAIVRLKYDTQTGEPTLLRLQSEKVPYGAQVLDQDQQAITIVGQGGIIYFRQKVEQLFIHWRAQGAAQSCQIMFDKQAVAKAKGRPVKAECK